MSGDVVLPEWSQFLFRPARVKCAYGGRGSSKSWTYARALLLLGASGRERILCTREVQKSIRDSVHRLLSDQIEAMGLQSHYDVLQTEIRGKNGTEFLFSGLSSVTIDSIKSYEGVTRVWCEEASSITKRSWDILIPTIRAPNSEIWITFNPELDSDETWKRFVVDPPAGSVIRSVNYTDNPWFPEVLEQERLACKIRSPEDYAQIWEGKCRSAVVGAIYGTEMALMSAQQRITQVPYDPRLKAHAVWDLGWNDAMSIGIVQRGPMGDVRLIGYIEESCKTLDWYAAELNKLPYNWGTDWVPHDAAAKDFKTGKSTVELLRAFGRKPRLTPNVGVENGIKAVRMMLPRLWIDKSAERLVDCLRRYRRAVPVSTGEPASPVHDEWSHGADMVRYMAVVEDKLKNEDDTPAPVAVFECGTNGMGY